MSHELYHYCIPLYIPHANPEVRLIRHEEPSVANVHHSNKPRLAEWRLRIPMTESERGSHTPHHLFSKENPHLFFIMISV